MRVREFLDRALEFLGACRRLARCDQPYGGRTKAEECEVQFKCDKALTYKIYNPIYQSIANAGGVIAVMHEVR